MKSFLAALAFALLVGLCVGTAAIQVENVRTRERIELWAEGVRAARVECAAERQRWDALTRLDNLVELWLELRRSIEAGGT